MPQFFIDRPRFAWVVTIILTIAGLLALASLPVASYPSIAPPNVSISANYPGASAKTVENTVTKLLEAEMNGIEGLRYMSSESTRTGSSLITLSFEIGTDTDIAGVEVQNRISRVESRLPSVVRQQGIVVDKTRPDFLMMVSLTSPDGTHDGTFLSDYADANIIGEIQRIPGVGSTQLFGSKYAMRIWLNPKRMVSFGITPGEVSEAISNQNAQLAAGQLGAMPAPDNQQLNATVTVPSRLSSPEEFGNIILRSSADGALVRIKDIARVERGSNSYSTNLLYNGKQATGFMVKLSNTGNALETAEAITLKMDELKKFFPEDMDWVSPYDTSIFVDVSIQKVFETLIEAIALVTLVMFIFLQNWRSILIPLIVVPVSLISTGIGLYVFGFSLNMLTLFGMVLAIGIVVDDAILVVENVERLMEEEGLSPYQATKKGMSEISGAIVGTTLVLMAVFIPMSFISGSVGQIYKQFALTIIVSVGFSSILALSLSPAIAQGLLKAQGNKKPSIFKRVGNGFNYILDRFTDGYIAIVKFLLTKVGIVIGILLFALVVFIDYSKLTSLPTGFVPTEDQGFIVTGAQLPSGATQERTHALIKKTDAWIRSQPEVESVVSVLGFFFSGSGQNAAVSFVKLRSWEEREAKGLRDADSLVAATNQAYQQFMGEGMSFAFNMPAIPGLGNDDGFDFRLQNRTSDPTLLGQATGQLMQMVGQAPDQISGFRPNTLPAAPQLKINIDRIKARALNIDIGVLNSTLQIALGSNYVNDYINDGNVRQVWIQANQNTRSTEFDIMSLQVSNAKGELVELKEIATTEWVQGAAKLTRYNGKPSMPFTGKAAPGLSSGDAIRSMEAFAEKLPKGIGYEWSGISLEEKISGNQVNYVYAFSLFIVFLVLVALYESWLIPLAVLLILPMGVLGSVLAAEIAGTLNDAYFAVGLITVIGLSAKNAIVIVEFARDAQLAGSNAYDAIVDACRLRFRPILMTSFAFVLGVVPLVLSTGAGAASRVAIGVVVFGGMLAATLLVIFFVPIFYLLIQKIAPIRISQEQMEVATENKITGEV